MKTTLRRVADRAAERLAVQTGRARRVFARQHGVVRLLTYHGVVPDTMAGRPWVPSQAVTVSQFERQMARLARLGDGIVQPLLPALERLGDPDRAEAAPAIGLTFDDGLADNVTLALPILQRYGFAATFFLTTGLVGTEQLLPADVARLLRRLHADGRLRTRVPESCRRILTEPGAHKRVSLGSFRDDLYALWDDHRDLIDPAAVESLRLMSWDDARALRDAGMTVGAHTVHHVILAREDLATRRREIEDSIARVQRELGVSRVSFAYPNGQAGDFGDEDMAILAACDVPCAVTQVPGINDARTPRLVLRRHCIGLHIPDAAFVACAAGLRDRSQAPARVGRQMERRQQVDAVLPEQVDAPLPEQDNAIWPNGNVVCPDHAEAISEYRSAATGCRGPSISPASPARTEGGPV